MAMGEKLNYPKDHKKRAWDIIAIMTYSLFLSIFKKNFFLSNITYDKELSTFKPKKYRLLKLIRYTFNLSVVRYIFSKLFLILMKLLKTR
jgi:hypothetical protein